MTLVSTINIILSFLVVIGQIIAILIIVALISGQERFLDFFRKKALLFSFIIVLIAMLGSLFYSEIAGYEPCKLCWFQRIFMYPQLIILGLALWKKDQRIFRYTIVLSIIGTIIAGYHYLLQIGAAPAIPCSAVGYSISCSKTFVMQFGYITLPMMALTVFVLLVFFSIIAIRKTRTE